MSSMGYCAVGVSDSEEQERQLISGTLNFSQPFRFQLGLFRCYVQCSQHSIKLEIMPHKISNPIDRATEMLRHSFFIRMES